MVTVFFYDSTLFSFSDEAPDTGDDSDEDLITSYLGSNLGGGQGNADSLIPTIQVTPHSPNANRILGKHYDHSKPLS